MRRDIPKFEDEFLWAPRVYYADRWYRDSAYEESLVPPDPAKNTRKTALITGTAHRRRPYQGKD